MLENPVPPLAGALMEGLKQAVRLVLSGGLGTGYRLVQSRLGVHVDWTDFIYLSSAGIVAPMTTVRNQTELSRENHNVL